MILHNVIIGHAKYGNELRCGDICKYKVEGKDFKGIIIYEPEDFAFAFEQLDDSFPIVLMSKVDYGTIEKIINVYSIDSSFPDGFKWVEIYNSNFEQAGFITR